MTYRSAEEILQEADAGGMRRAFVATALLLEMEAVRSHLRPVGRFWGVTGQFTSAAFSQIQAKIGSWSSRKQEQARTPPRVP